MPDDIDIDLFRQLEQELHRPDIRSSREAVSGRLADDFLAFGSSGRVYDKHLTINSLAQEEPSDRVTLPEVRDFTVRMIGIDTVLVLYHSVRQADGDLPERTTLRSSIWKMIEENGLASRNNRASGCAALSSCYSGTQRSSSNRDAR